MSEYKYQHYVPKTYLNAWIDNFNELYLYNSINNCFIKQCKPSNILGLNDLYTKTVADSLICSSDDLTKIFECINDYKVMLGDKFLGDVNDYANQYYEFDKWVITNQVGQRISNKKIKDEIEKVRIISIEKGWSKFEDGWEGLIKRIVIGVEIKKIDLKDREDLKDFLTSQWWRTKDNIEYLKDMISEWLTDNRENEKQEDIIAEFSRCLFKVNIEKYQDGKEDSYITKIRSSLNNLYMVFYNASGNKSFYTSDKPVFFISNEDSFKKGRMNGLYFPITPKLLCALYRGNANDYSIMDLPINDIRRINKMIKLKSARYYISNRKI